MAQAKSTSKKKPETKSNVAELKPDQEFKSIDDLLWFIQKHLKAPKNQYNSFGKYNYRSCEDIVEGVKPLLPEGAFLIMQDDIKVVGGRYYVHATAVLAYQGKEIHSKALAREEESKKGMDGAQVTGSASSYARKYALNGLFMIDDTKDADTQDPKDNQPKKQTNKALPKEEFVPLSEDEYNDLLNAIVNCDDLDTFNEISKKLKAAKPRMTKQQAKDLGSNYTAREKSLQPQAEDENQDAQSEQQDLSAAADQVKNG